MKYIIWIVIISIFITGCVPVDRPQGGYVSKSDGTVFVWHDDRNLVTCWIYDGNYSGGIFCITDVQLGKQENIGRGNCKMTNKQIALILAVAIQIFRAKKWSTSIAIGDIFHLAIELREWLDGNHLQT